MSNILRGCLVVRGNERSSVKRRICAGEFGDAFSEKHAKIKGSGSGD